MTPNGPDNARNELRTQKLVGLEVLQVYFLLNTQKLRFPRRPAAAIFESAITQKVPGWCSITSVIFHVQVPLDSNQVRNSPNTKMYTGLIARYRTKICCSCKVQGKCVCMYIHFSIACAIHVQLKTSTQLV